MTTKESGKRAKLARQFKQRKVHIAGLQETRVRKTGLVENIDFVYAQSEADDDETYGCEVWLLSKTLAFPRWGGKAMRISKNDVGMVHAEPRMIVVCQYGP